MKTTTFALVGILATLALSGSAEAKTVHARSKLTTAQVERAKTRIEQDGTASIATTTKRTCSNISCLGYATMLGVGY